MCNLVQYFLNDITFNENNVVQHYFHKVEQLLNNILLKMKGIACLYIRPKMGKSHSKRHELVDCQLFTIAR